MKPLSPHLIRALSVSTILNNFSHEYWHVRRERPKMNPLTIYKRFYSDFEFTNFNRTAISSTSDQFFRCFLVLSTRCYHLEKWKISILLSILSITLDCLFEFSKSDSRFIISEPKNLHIPILSQKIRIFSKFYPPYRIRHFKIFKFDIRFVISIIRVK